MQAILIADYSYTPVEYWQHVSKSAKNFIDRCLTIDPVERITADQALSHPWVTGEGEEGSGRDLLPNVKKNFNARRTLHAAIDTIRAINQLRAGGLAAMTNKTLQDNRGEPMDGVEQHPMPAEEDVRGALGQLTERDPRGHARGQTASMIEEQQRRIKEVTNGLWTGRR